jgi:hypothetical protein
MMYGSADGQVYYTSHRLHTFVTRLGASCHHHLPASASAFSAPRHIANSTNFESCKAFVQH